MASTHLAFYIASTNMTKREFQKFVSFLMRESTVWASQKRGREVVLDKVTDSRQICLTSQLPLYSFKKLLVPCSEILFTSRGRRIIQERADEKNQVILGLTIIDLRALVLLNQVFEKDPYYQERMNRTLVVGQSFVPRDRFQFFMRSYEEDFLEHLQFDIFLGIQKEVHRGEKKDFKIFTGSLKGQRVLDEFGYKEYEHIQFSGPIKEEGLNPEMIEIRNKMKYHHNPKIWEDLGKICIECGKCSIVCPTCFCFDIKDKTDLKGGQRIREWSSCFYNEFSQVGGGFKFLSTTAKKIHNWYWHHFVRTPDEFSFPGCVGCGRCIRVCPAGIDIREVIERIKKS
ncbi:MAG: hypothetical protein COX43_00090 [Parcubacteria group bacterium CG23_combo_of_CG06-09_8_20_14_all_35_9]|nr:MAG: hypothetical protein COX43_00090 [Parcubacteria group bacterium CG23_combo_of_CG06-09_8_20_14_all_35_9]